MAYEEEWKTNIQKPTFKRKNSHSEGPTPPRKLKSVSGPPRIAPLETLSVSTFASIFTEQFKFAFSKDWVLPLFFGLLLKNREKCIRDSPPPHLSLSVLKNLETGNNSNNKSSTSCCAYFLWPFHTGVTRRHDQQKQHSSVNRLSGSVYETPIHGIRLGWGSPVNALDIWGLEEIRGLGVIIPFSALLHSFSGGIIKTESSTISPLKDLFNT